MLIFINPDLSVLSSSALLPVALLLQGGEALKLSTSVPAITNYPKSSSLGYFKSNLRSTLTQTSGILDSQQQLNKQSVQRIRYSTLRGGGGKPRVNNCSIETTSADFSGMHAPIHISFCSKMFTFCLKLGSLRYEKV